MKKGFIIILLLLPIIGLYACDAGLAVLNDDADTFEKKLFVWNGLNTWYFWQDKVDDLADDRREKTLDFAQYLDRFPNEKALFDHLIYDSEDRFPWFIEDYEEHEAARLGSSKSFGFRYGLRSLGSNDEVFGYVQYVVRGSPAEKAGLERGDIFNRINGQKLTLNNYSDLLNSDVYKLNIALLRRTDLGNLTLVNTNDVIQISAELIQENPIHTARMYNAGNSTIGYLLYNSFRFNYHEELNDQFNEFKNNGVNELVLDLRYNSGGALITTSLLASMITGLSSENVFAQLKYGAKRSNQNFTYKFADKLVVYDDNGMRVDNGTIDINSLNLNRVFVLTSTRTASASETLINGLNAYGIEVIIIGENTVGKDLGSITVYDAPPTYTQESRENLNPNHKRAMQPIVFKIFNRLGIDYPNGFAPDISESEVNYLIGGLPPLGHQEEHLFKIAIGLITNTFLAKEQSPDIIDEFEYIMDSSELNPFNDELYLLPEDMVQLPVYDR
ncbi:MAG: S41 family peptidase [Balneolaceae bacterium]